MQGKRRESEDCAIKVEVDGQKSLEQQMLEQSGYGPYGECLSDATCATVLTVMAHFTCACMYVRMHLHVEHLLVYNNMYMYTLVYIA